jgi:hypothetical protein
VVIKKSSVENNGVEFREASLPGYELGSRGIELSRVIGLGNLDLMCDLKSQWDCYEIRCQDTTNEDGGY